MPGWPWCPLFVNSQKILIQNITGSKEDIPKNLLEQVRHLEEIFTVDTQKLKSITDHFISELAKGEYWILRS